VRFRYVPLARQPRDFKLLKTVFGEVSPDSTPPKQYYFRIGDQNEAAGAAIAAAVAGEEF
jgi:hypothetical protein